MTNELAKIDPKEYGLEQKQVVSIEQAFAPKIAERDAMIEVYETMLTAEITPVLCKQAKELRLKLMKTRTGIAEIHKTQKAFFLAAGRFVDAWKNKETAPIEQMEENLADIEKYYERLEAEKVAKLAAERETEIRKYSDVIPYDLGRMELSVYANYLTGLKVAQEARLAAEKAAEAERLRLIEVEKENARLKAIEDEKIRKENERLKKEAEQKEKALLAERKEAEEKLAAERAEAERKLKEQQEQARKEAEKAAAEKAKLDAIIKAAEDKAESERKAKEAAELAVKLEAEKAEKAPRKQKLTVWVDSFEIPEFANDDVAADISAKFVAFKGWAKGQVEKL